MTLTKPSVLAADERLAVGLERELADLDGDAVALAFLLRAADRRDLRPRIGRARHLEVVDGLGLCAGDRMNRGDALVRGHVREQQAADDVADRVEVRLRGAHPAVDLDEALLDLGARRLEADVVRVRRTAGGHEHLLGAQLLGLLALLADHQADATLVGRHRGRIEARGGDRPAGCAAVNERSSSLDTSPSSSGVTRGRYSSSVTSTPASW